MRCRSQAAKAFGIERFFRRLIAGNGRIAFLVLRKSNRPNRAVAF
jgi:hypothetical protein